MAQSKFYSMLPMQPPIDRVLRRLGIGQADAALCERIDALASTIHIQGKWLRLKIRESSPQIVLENGDRISSKGLAKLLHGCCDALYMASSAGDLAARMHALKRNGNMRDAVLLDATAAQMADRGLSVMQRMLNQILLREGYRVTTARYSAGYGDLPLAFQKTLYQALHLEELGIRMLESYMLEPEKTVLAIAGVKSIEN